MAVLIHDLLDAVEDEVGIAGGCDGFLGVAPAGIYLAGKRLALCRLWQIAHHGYGILSAIVHLVQVYQNLGVAAAKVNILMKEHGGIAMGVERERVFMHPLGVSKQARLIYKPTEEWQPAGAHPLGMPLHTEYGFMFAALNGLDDTVGGSSRYHEMRSGLAHRLVVERVDEERATVVK